MNYPDVVTIYGVGLIGASLALALRDYVQTIIGIDPDKRIHEKAVTLGIVDQIFDYPPPIGIFSDIIILAAPVKINLEILENLAQYHEAGAIVLDLSSTKLDISQVMLNLPARFDPIGGHPMCGKETSSLDFADPEIFRGATFALTPLARTTSIARQTAANLVRHIGSHAFWVDAASHDQMVAATSHLPYLVANALAGMTPLEMSALIGPGFVSTSRLAGSNIPMMLDILKTNRQNILQVLLNYFQHLDSFRTALEDEDYAALEKLMTMGRDTRDRILVSTQTRESS